MLPHALLSLLVFKHSFIQIYFGIFDFFCFCFMSNKYYLILLNFTSYLFSVKKKIYWLETYIMKLKCLGKSVSLKYFMFHKCPWTCISRNALKEKFHEMLWKKNFTVYLCLNRTYRKDSFSLVHCQSWTRFDHCETNCHYKLVFTLSNISQPLW